MADHTKFFEDEFLPFNLSKAGNSISMDIHVSWIYHMINPNPTEIYLKIKWPHIHSFGDPAFTEYNKLLTSLSGVSYYGPETGLFVGHIDLKAPIKPHKGMAFHVVIKKKWNGKVLYEYDVFPDKLGHFGDEFLLAQEPLPAGNYVATVTTLQDDDRFDGKFETGLTYGTTFK